MARQKTRSQGYYTRKVNNRELRQRFLIVCEGTKTEPNYFKNFRLPTKEVIQIDIEGVGKSPIDLVKKAQTLQNKQKYDQVWCVFDRDHWPEEDFTRALSDAAKQGFKVAYSNEAFELWYVLHFEFLNTGISRKAYSSKLSSLLGRPYQKNSESIYEDLLGRQGTAIKNAENLLKQYNPHNPAKDNPSTSVHLLVQELNRFIP